MKLSKLETEGADEAWNLGLLPTSGAPLRRSLTGLTSSGPRIPTSAFFKKRAEKANEYWFNEGYGPDMYIRVDKIVEGIDLDTLAPYTVLFIVTYTDVGQETEEYTSESEAIERIDSLQRCRFHGRAFRGFPRQVAPSWVALPCLIATPYKEQP